MKRKPELEPSTGSMPTFLITWLGQVVSLTGSGLTSFALGVWVFERTNSPTLFAFIGFFAVLPRIFFSPIAGVLVDRFDRRKIMILADAGAGLSTLFISLLLFTGHLELWHIYLSATISALCGAFQWPAYAASVAQLVSRKHLGRANGMIQFGRAAAEIFSPLLAGLLILTIKLQGVILIDVATFLFAMLTLLMVRFPRLESEPARIDPSSLKNEIPFGWRYIRARKGLLNLLLFFCAVNFIWGMVGALIVPMILNFTTPDKLGAIITIAGTGMLAGSLLMTAWGGPRRRVYGVILFELLSGFCFILMGLRPDFWLVAIGAFGAHFTIAIVFGSNQTIWQTRVEPENHGRVFATQQMFTSLTQPLAYLSAGPLAEKFFGPLMIAGGPLSLKLASLLGSGTGRGIGLMFVLMGLVKIAISVFAYLNPRMRLIENAKPGTSAPTENKEDGFH
ncbi:MAG: MFS transporter [Anaerolineales bacterium]|nr:MFS transporter [Anaerolineales bacterium]